VVGWNANNEIEESIRAVEQRFQSHFESNRSRLEFALLRPAEDWTFDVLEGANLDAFFNRAL
jgi:hypothetical protein